MPLTLSHCIPSDAPELAGVHLAVYSQMPRNIVENRETTKADILKTYEKSFASGIAEQENPTSSQQKHYLKVTDSHTNQIAAYLIWIYLPDGYEKVKDPQAQVKEVPAGANENLIRDFSADVGRIRSEHPGRHEAHWLLSLLGTHPNYERRGAAAQLIRWPFSQADAGGKRCYVDSSSMGYPLYKRLGFESDVGEMTLDLDEYEGGKGMGVQRWVAMLREPQKVH